MTYNIVGTGNMAWFLAKRLKEAGMECRGVYGRNARKVTELTRELYAPNYGTIMDVPDDADVCILAVSDKAIAEITLLLSLEKGVLIHTAGSVGLETTAGAAQDRAVLWPIYSILKADLPLHNKIPCAWEATSAKAKKVATTLAATFSDTVFEAKGEQRRWLHLSAVISNNFINHMMAICEQICISQHLSFSVLQPILQQTLERTLQHSPADMQTGPAIRNDKNTINSHLELLKLHPEWAELYRVISSSIEKMYSYNHR